MDADLKPIYDRVMVARRPEEVFKEFTTIVPPRLLAKHLASEMEEMRSVLDPLKYSSFDDREAAQEARTRLETFYNVALLSASKGTYALDDYSTLPLQKGSKKIVVEGQTYVVGEKIAVGEYSTVYKGRMALDHGSGGVVMRLANTPADNPRVQNEIRLLDLLHRLDVGYWQNIPFMLARFSAGERVGIIERYFDGLTLTELRTYSLHRAGLDQRHVVWVMARLLGLLGYVHSLGIVHGRITPDHVRIRPSNHNALLSGWGHSVYKPATTHEQIISRGGLFEAPEIQDKKAVGPWTDIYSLGKTLIWLIGGDPVTNEMPDAVEPKVRRFLQNMVPKNFRARPHDAWQLYEAQNRLKDSLWERRFIHLNIA